MAVQDPDEVVIPNKLWMGDVRSSIEFVCLIFLSHTHVQLEPYMDETFLKGAFAHYGFHLVCVKWVQDKITGLARGTRL